MRKNSNGKSGDVISALLIIIVAMLFASVVFTIVLGINDLIATGFLLLYIAVILAVIAGMIVALVQRLRELKAGEAEEAKKY